MTHPLLRPYHRDNLQLPNRIAMAPMTRGRADDATGIPVSIMSTYYAQRAGAGLIVTEGIWPHPSGKGGPGIPGLATAEQADGWREVTDAVHAAGGRIFAQLWHVGRVNHPENLGGDETVAPSSVAIGTGQIFTRQGWREHHTPRELSTTEVEQLVESFADAARRAVEAGFDGVEIHGANGYLIQQFLAENTNKRQDKYGRRTRFAIEVTEAVVAAVGAQRVGLRISPDNPENDIAEETPQQTYRELLAAIEPLGLAYLHIVERGDYQALADLRPRWNGTLIANYNGPQPTTTQQGTDILDAGLADLVSFGRAFIANPDLPERIATDAPLSSIDRESLYGAGAKGYIDYPALNPVS